MEEISTLAEVEIRLPDPHMDVYSNSAELLSIYQPGSFFRDSEPCGMPSCRWVEDLNDPIFNPPTPALVNEAL